MTEWPAQQLKHMLCPKETDPRREACGGSSKPERETKRISEWDERKEGQAVCGEASVWALGKARALGRAEPTGLMVNVEPGTTQSSLKPRPANYLDFSLSFPTCICLGPEGLQMVSSSRLKSILSSTP